MVSIPFHSWSYVIKSMDTLSHDSLGLVEVHKVHISFYEWTWYFGI